MDNNRKLVINNASISQTRMNLKGLTIKTKKDSDIGVYCIECKETNSIYVGQSINITGRFKNHKSLLIAKKHGVSRMQLDFNLFGVSAFEFYTLFNCEQDNLLKHETQYIKEFLAKGYNMYNTVIDTDSTCLLQISKEQEPVFKKILKALSNNSLSLSSLENGIDAIIYNS